MPEVKDMYAGKFLSATDLPPAGLGGKVVECGIEKMPPKNGVQQNRVTITLDSAWTFATSRRAWVKRWSDSESPD